MPDDVMDQALALLQQGALAEAEVLYHKIIADAPDHVDAQHLLGLVVAQQGRLDEAVGILRTVIGLRDDLSAAHSNLGNVLKLQGRLDDALASYNRALELDADNAEAYSNRGNVFRDLGRNTEALADYDAAIARSPDFADAYYNRGVVLQGTNRLDEALIAYQRAIACAPGNAQAHNNLALVLEVLFRREEALLNYSRATQLNPDFALAQLNESFCRLLDGDFRNGWPKYEYRRKLPGMRNPGGRPESRQWLAATPPRGSTVLLWAEQGLGDTIQFSRYAAVLAGLGVKVMLEVQPPLKALLSTIPGLTAVCAQGEAIPDFDFHSPLLSVPMLLGTDFSNIPADVPYICAYRAKVEKFSRLLGEKQRLRVGVVWSGNPNPYNQNDHRRSVPLELFRELLDPRVQWVCLQKDIRPPEQPLFDQLDIVDFRHKINDFSGTAALMELMDLVISIDTSVAHLAGAMGKPTWILLPHLPDWRWFLDREDSPWYPTARLFRQHQHGDWGAVVERIKAELHARV